VNIWKARPKLPATVISYISPDMLAWTDYAIWPAKKFQCAWQIEPHFFTEHIHCHGVTRYEPALGGRGTRITFDGNVEITAASLPGVPATLENVVAQGIEAFLSALIPKNFRKVTEAMGKTLDGK
jgi:hypothetical protein